jgi:polysaccharide export outer membrane protein
MWMAQQPLNLPNTVYRIAPPDKVRIVAPGIKEIDGQETVIRPDGTMSLNLVGDIKVAGLTPGEVSEVLAQRLGTYYRADTIDVSVQVVDFKSQHFYVFGQVSEPGIKPYTGRDTILKVLADAQLNEDAWPQKVVIVRPNEDPNVHQRVTVDVKEMWQDGKTQQNFLVEAGDVIYVPMSPLANVKQTVTRIVSPIVPATDLGLMVMTGGI